MSYLQVMSEVSITQLLWFQQMVWQEYNKLIIAYATLSSVSACTVFADCTLLNTYYLYKIP